MRLPRINKKKVYYALYAGKTEIMDSEGNPTGQYSVSYGDPTEIWINVGPASGLATQNEFGIHDGATIQLTTSNIAVEFDTKTVWWIDAETTAEHNYETVSVAKSKSARVIRLQEVSVNDSASN